MFCILKCLASGCFGCFVVPTGRYVTMTALIFAVVTIGSSEDVVKRLGPEEGSRRERGNGGGGGRGQ